MPPQAAAPHGPGYALPALGQAMQHQAPREPSNIEREREMREREMRDRDMRERQRQQEGMAQRVREQREREQRERQQREAQSQPHQTDAGSIPIHQPVASRAPAAIHGPGGLLSGSAAAGPAPPGGAFGAPAGPGTGFGGGVASSDGPHRQLQSLPPQQTQAQPIALNGNPAAHPMQGVAGLPQGQQPILNDALSYLDQVKVQFVDQPDVYNRFLDIMKDFKSQAIDTPGVIERVSTLFAGHPNLIQGFNTFLPPGYRIECGTGDDPNAIRVTTPMGTTVSSMGAGLSQPPTLPSATNGSTTAPRQPPYYDQTSRGSSSNWQQQPQPGQGGPEGMFTPGSRAVAPPTLAQQTGQGQSQNSQVEPSSQREPHGPINAAALAQHQQEQRGVSQLQNAVTAAANGPNARQPSMQGSPNASQAQMVAHAGPNGVAPGSAPAGQPGLEKRGPVEFNHAISYVNKIKNRFASQPEIYKQFLEILQTYQRESKPIQDVYAQVTQLFNAAPDLLEDFKQFLPESAAQAKAQAAAKQAAEDAAMLSNVRGEPSYANGTPSGSGAQPGGTAQRAETKLPPLGKFEHPPSATKESKKRRAGAAGQAGLGAAQQSMLGSGDVNSQGGRSGIAPGAHANKRAKIHHAKAGPPDMPAVSPTLTPALPEPLPPTTTPNATPEEFAFFDRVKKFIGNKQVMNEFLKLLNLFSQDLIDKNVLVNKAANFIGGNPDLMTWFKSFVGHKDGNQVFESRPRLPNGKVTLSSCRGYGPSYRLLPRRERLKQCSGRDEMCYSVLNDDWASHPTWASEDASFVAHRKNMYEEALHRIEEERHDYDFNIEANLRTIQLLEPIAQQILAMTEDERATFTLSPGIGGQSTAIYQRVIKKVYGEHGLRVIEELYTRPCAVVPILLTRLKQKDEEWKASQREWEKVWRDQTQRMFYKSLDHQGIHAKTSDKKLFNQKMLIAEIQAKYEEQQDQRYSAFKYVPKHQFEYTFEDISIVQDIARLLLTYAESSPSFSNQLEKQKIDGFVKEFMPKFFGLDLDKFKDDISAVTRRPADDDVEADGDTPAPADHLSRSRRAVNGKRADLLRGVLERGRPGRSSRQDNEGSATPRSKESTPDVASAVDDDMSGVAIGSQENGTIPDAADDNWIQHPGATAARSTKPLERDISRNEPFRREMYSFYCNHHIYAFMRIFQVIYERLVKIKENEANVAEGVRRAKVFKPAHDLKMIDKRPESFFKDTSSSANYYEQVLEMSQEVMEQNLDAVYYEDMLRHFYMQCGWQLYSLERTFGALAKFALLGTATEAKERGYDIMQLFFKDRDKKETTHQAEINYRKQVEKLVKEGETYVIVYHQPTTRTTLQVLKKDDMTFDEETMSPEAKWSYYTASYIKIEPTEGVPITDKFNMPLLRRNLPDDAEDPEESKRAIPHAYANQLEMRICVNSYRILWVPSSMDYFVHSDKERTTGADAKKDLERAKERRNKAFEEKFVLASQWRKEASKEVVAGKDEAYRKWIAEGLGTSAGGDGDQVMEDA
ncbi:MAG: Transcriptional regulatory protein sin3 [Piccolia ochrophora]|nr:MAG: Transcriptional regulatory protein sin3 [Piccolia ochrophora]